MGNEQTRGEAAQPSDVADASLVPMPASDELDKMFEQWMEEAGTKANARAAMRQMPADKKWFVLQQELLKKSNAADVDASSENKPEYWTKLLSSSTLTPDDLRTLRVIMSSQGKPWLALFVQHGGLDALLTAFARAQTVEQNKIRDEIQVECLNVLKAFMNNQYGLDVVVRMPAAIDALALLFDSTNDRLRIQVLTLLTVVAWLSAEGHNQVLLSLSHLPYPSRFTPFITALGEHSNVDLVCTVLTFINTMVNSCHELESRVTIRNELMENGCASLLPALRKWAARFEGPDFRSVEAQIEVFENEHQHDQRETTRSNVDLANATEVFEFVRKAAMEDGFSAQLLQTLQLLMNMSSDHDLGSSAWQNIVFMVRAAMDASVLQEDAEHADSIDDESIQSDHGTRLRVEFTSALDVNSAPNAVQVVDEIEDVGVASAMSYLQLKSALDRRLEMQQSGRQTRLALAQEQVDKVTRSYHEERIKAMDALQKVADCEQQVVSLSSQKFALEIQVGQLESSIASLLEQLNSTCAQSNTHNTKFQELVSQLKSLEDLKPQLLQAQTELDAERAKCKAAQDLVEALKGSAQEQVDKVVATGPPLGPPVAGPYLGPPVVVVVAGPPKNVVGALPMGPAISGPPLQVGLPAGPPLGLSLSGPPPATGPLIASGPPVSGPILGPPVGPAVCPGMVGPPIPIGPRAPMPGLPLGPPVSGPPGFSAAPPAPIGPQLVPKRVIKPTQSLRAFHWSTLPAAQIEKTLWRCLTDEERAPVESVGRSDVIRAVQIDLADIEAKFGTAPAKPKEDSVVVVAEKKEEKKEAVHLIDGKKANAVEISLSRYKISHSQIRDAILQFDADILTPERVSQLIKLCPTKEDLDSISSFDGEAEQLGTAEKFFQCIAPIPRLELRLQLFAFKHNYDANIAELEGSLEQVENAAKGVRNSKHLSTVLATVLSLGNHLNGNTARGGAYGFKLATLTKLVNTKSADNKINLLHYLVELLQQRKPETLGFVDDLHFVEAATKVESAFLSGEMAKFKKTVAQLETELKSPHPSSNDKFVDVMTQFAHAAMLKSEKLGSRLETLSKECQELAALFGEPTNTKWEDLFRIFDEFVKQFSDARKEVDRMRIAREKEEQRKAAELIKAQQLEANKLKEPSGASSTAPTSLLAQMPKKPHKDIVDNVIGTLQNADSTSIINEIRRRRQETQGIGALAAAAAGLASNHQIKSPSGTFNSGSFTAALRKHKANSASMEAIIRRRQSSSAIELK